MTATTSKNNWIVRIQASRNNPYDGATLKSAINQVQQLTRIRPNEAVVGRGYRDKHYHLPDDKIHITGERKASGALKNLLQRRNAIEPVISHDKHDQGLYPNHLKG